MYRSFTPIVIVLLAFDDNFSAFSVICKTHDDTLLRRLILCKRVDDGVGNAGGFALRREMEKCFEELALNALWSLEKLTTTIMRVVKTLIQVIGANG